MSACVSHDSLSHWQLSPVFVTIPSHYFNPPTTHSYIKSLPCSPRVLSITILCDCKIPPLALISPLVISSLTTIHVLLLVPCHGFAFLMVRWRVKESTVALWRGRESAGFLCDVCCEIAAVSPEETQTAQCECTLKALLSLADAGQCFWF